MLTTYHICEGNCKGVGGSTPTRLLALPLIAWIILATLALSGCSSDSGTNDNDDSKPPPGSENNRVRIECPDTLVAPAADTIIDVDVFFTNDNYIAGFTLGFHYNSSDLEIVGATPGLLIAGDSLVTASYPDDNLFLVLWFVFNQADHIAPQEEGQAFSLQLSMPADIAPQDIDLDSAFVAPAGYFRFAVRDDVNDEVTPGWDDCGTADIVIRSEAVQKRDRGMNSTQPTND